VNGDVADSFGDGLSTCARSSGPDWVMTTASSRLAHIDFAALDTPSRLFRLDQSILEDGGQAAAVSVVHTLDVVNGSLGQQSTTIDMGDECGVLFNTLDETRWIERFDETGVLEPPQTVAYTSIAIGDCGDLDFDGQPEACMALAVVPGPFVDADGVLLELDRSMARTPDRLLGGWSQSASFQGRLTIWSLPMDVDNPVPDVTLLGGVEDASAGASICVGLEDTNGSRIAFVGGPTFNQSRGMGWLVAFDEAFPEGATLHDVARPVAGTARDVHFGLVCATGDVDGDGAADLVVGAHGGNWNFTPGRVYVFPGPFPPVDPDDAVLQTDWVLEGPHVGSEFGRGVALADLDGDGFDELLIGAPGAAPEGAGLVEIWPGPMSPPD
jgi:hypothetical protein